MSKTLHGSSVDKASASGLGSPVMVYMCECGAKWTNPTKPAWQCKCGRPLVKRNGIIHSAMSQTSGQMISRGRTVRMTVG